MSSNIPWWARFLRSNYFGGFCILLVVVPLGWLIASFLFPLATDPEPNTSPDTVTDAQAGDSVFSWMINHGPDWEALVSRIKHEEGFRALPYQDTRGFETIGYGTKFPLLDSDWNCDAFTHAGVTERQADCLLRSRLSDHYIELSHRWGPFNKQPEPVQMALLDMVYQLGVDGVLGFHEMLPALARHDYAAAIREAMDSVWDRETPSRVDRVVSVFRSQESDD